jgi:hypothetical protein
MTTTVAPATAAGLGPLVADLLDGARADSSELVRAAEAEGRDALRDAGAQVEAALVLARGQGAAEGAAQAAAELAGARRQARARILAAQADLYQEVRRAARDGVRALLEEDGNRRKLGLVLRARLGARCRLADTADGGLLGVAEDGRTIDASVASLADAAVEQLDLGELWTS